MTPADKIRLTVRIVLALLIISGFFFRKLQKSSLSDRKKSFIVASGVYTMILLILFLIRFWPPTDAELFAMTGGGGGGGVSVNFGDTDLGAGTDYKSKELDVKEVSKPTPVQESEEEDIIADENEADKTDIVVPKKDPVKNPKPIVKPIIKPVEPKPKPKPKVNQNTNDALANLLNGNNKGGDGDSGTRGNQGSANGNINSNGYGAGGSGGGTGGGNGTGNGIGSGAGSGSGTGGGNGSGNGLGNGSGYSLAGRKALSKPKPDYNCNEEGIVVVQITVDKNGTVVEAKPGARGTTNTAGCLASQAKIAAMNTKWDTSPDGNDKQVGTIKYTFNLKD